MGSATCHAHRDTMLVCCQCSVRDAVVTACYALMPAIAQYVVPPTYSIYHTPASNSAHSYTTPNPTTIHHHLYHLWSIAYADYAYSHATPAHQPVTAYPAGRPSCSMARAWILVWMAPMRMSLT